MIRLAHLSDLHATHVHLPRLADFASKRLLGWLSWRARRGKTHRAEVLEAMLRDLSCVAADHVVVTGDLTNLACEHEFEEARAWLERLGPPEHVSVVPGNHDAYVAMPRGRSWDRWLAYLASDAGAAPGGFPTLRVRGSLALVGVCSAEPSAPLLATGRPRASCSWPRARTGPSSSPPAPPCPMPCAASRSTCTASTSWPTPSKAAA